jgi:hypothetical protein
MEVIDLQRFQPEKQPQAPFDKLRAGFQLSTPATKTCFFTPANKLIKISVSKTVISEPFTHT